MAQSWRVKSERHKKPGVPLDAESLQRLALAYVGRYATTRAKLRTYLVRKLRERGWPEEIPPPPLDELVERFATLGYVDDRAFAAARSAALQRRGFGERRVDQALHAAGIDPADSEAARGSARDGAWASALRFAERKRIGPFALAEADRDGRRRAFAALMRAGHSAAIARSLLNMAPGDIPDLDSF